MVTSTPAYEYGPDSLLAPLERFIWAGYVWRGIVVPRAAQAVVLPRAQAEERVAVPPGAWLVALAGFSAQPEGFRFRLFDVGARAPALGDLPDELFTGAQDTGDEDPIMHVLPEPYAVIPPGILQVVLINNSTTANNMQLLLHFAVPRESDAYVPT